SSPSADRGSSQTPRNRRLPKFLSRSAAKIFCAAPSIHRGRSRPLFAGRAGKFTPPRVASRGRSSSTGQFSDAEEQAVAEVSLEVGREDLLRGPVDVVRDPLELEGPLVGV